MKRLALAAATAAATLSSPAIAQSGSVQVQPGFFCAINKCVRFSSDLSEVSIQGRRAVSVEGYNLRANPVISSATYREIFQLALRQSGVNGTRG